jgi:hypothetical protein
MTYDRHDLYERTVQSPDRIVSFLRAIHGRSPVAIGEDFCGTAAVSRALSVPGNTPAQTRNRCSTGSRWRMKK